jgi:hypothetical protein
VLSRLDIEDRLQVPDDGDPTPQLVHEFRAIGA